jgi:hypothetical protein
VVNVTPTLHDPLTEPSSELAGYACKQYSKKIISEKNVNPASEESLKTRISETMLIFWLTLPDSVSEPQKTLDSRETAQMTHTKLMENMANTLATVDED